METEPSPAPWDPSPLSGQGSVSCSAASCLSTMGGRRLSYTCTEPGYPPEPPAEIQVCDVHGLLMKPATVRKVGYQLNKEINDVARLVL